MATRLGHNEVGRPLSPATRNVGNDFFSNLAPELVTMIVDHLRPTGSIIICKTIVSPTRIRPVYIQARSDFSNLSRVSKSIHPFATLHLYGTVVLRNQREQAVFFCTLANNPHLRLAVRSFAWAGDLSNVDWDAEEIIQTRFGRQPSTSEAIPMARLMRSVRRDAESASNVLAIVLAMISEVKSIAMVLDTHEIDSWEVMMRERGKEIEGGELYCPNRQFLQKLETVSFQVSLEHQHSGWVVPWFWPRMLLNLPILRRLEVQGAMDLLAVVDSNQELRGSSVISESVKEVLHFGASRPDNEMMGIVTAFPNLSILKAEFSGFPCHFDTFGSKASQALLNISTTLETLSLTTTAEARKYGRRRYWLHNNAPPWPPLLLTLNQMSLKHLTTESVWLFGRDNPLLALQLSDLLPQTLITLRLIDYWGCLYDTYPRLPNNWTPLEYYDHVFRTFYEECSTRLPSLRQIVIVSNHLLPKVTTVASSGGQDQPSQGFLPKFRDLFGSIGVRFFISDLESPRRKSPSLGNGNW